MIPDYKVGPTRKAGIMKFEFGPYYSFTCGVEEGTKFARNVVMALRLTREAQKIALGIESDFGEGTIVSLPETEDHGDDFDRPFV